jgi:hypothetical protein
MIAGTASIPLLLTTGCKYPVTGKIGKQHATSHQDGPDKKPA